MKEGTRLTFWKRISVLIALLMALTAASGLLSACSSGSIELNETSHTMYVSDTFRLTATTGEEGAEVTWASSDEAVATVRNGIVSARAVGKATVTASLEGGASATCEITVLDRTVTISETSITINMDETTTHKLTATSSDDGAITWSTSDSSVATVSGGTVTAVNTGTATITAQRGAAKATCEVTVIMPSRPADWHELEMMNNAGCVAEAGTWFYFADGSSGDCSFGVKPNYGGNELNVSINTITNDGAHFFMFRYQPKEDAEGEEFKVGDTYEVSFKATVSKDATLRFGGPGMFGEADLTANEESEISWEAKISSAEPFSIRPQGFEAPTADSPLTIKITEISFVKTQEGTGEDPSEGDDTPVIEIEPNVTGSYQLAAKNKADTIADPGKVHYWADGGEGTNYALNGIPEMKDGTVTLSFSKMTTGANYQLRLQPKDIAVGTQYAITFTATLNRDSSIKYGSDRNNEFTNKTLKNGEPTKITYIGTVDASAPFFIALNVFDAEDTNPVTLTVSGIGVKEYVAPDPEPETNELTMSNNAGCIAAPGQWFYWADGNTSDYVFAVKPYEKDGTVGFSVKSSNLSDSQYFVLRYQPDKDANDAAIGLSDTYKIEFKAVLSKDGVLRYGAPDAAGNATQDSYKTIDVTAGQEVTISIECVLGNKEPFSIRPQGYAAPSEAEPLTLTLSEITVTKIKEGTGEYPSGGEQQPSVTVEPNVTGTYDLEKHTNTESIKNAGKVHYFADGSEGTGYVLNGTPSMDDGKVTISFSKMENGKTYQLRFQPADLQDGDTYVIQFKITLNRDASVSVGTKGKYETVVLKSGVETTVTYYGTVNTSEPFSIKIMSYDASTENPVTVVVDKIGVQKTVEE